MNTAGRLLQLLVLALVLALGTGSALAQKNKGKQDNEFPNATRAEPKLVLSPGNTKKINQAYELLEEGESAKAQAILEVILANPKSSKYEQALSLQGLSRVYADADDIVAAIEANEKVLALDALDNKSHFAVVLQLAQMNMMEERYDAVLPSIDQWFALTGSETAETWAMRGNALYRLERMPEAATAMTKAISMAPEPSDSWYQILIASYYDAENYAEAAKAAETALAREPGNKNITRQLASIYIELEQGDKAIAVLEGAKARGLLTEAADLRQLYQLYNYIERPVDAARTINEGIAAGVLKEDFDTLKGLGDSWVISAQEAADESAEQKDGFSNAIEAYGRAAKLAKDGEMDFIRGQLLVQEKEQFAEGKKALEAALARGSLKREGEAYILLGNAEAELGNQPAAIAAYQKARGYPNTKAMAESWLKSMGNR